MTKDIFPIFIITALVGFVGWMFWMGFPWGIILTISLLGIGFGIAELICSLTIKKTVSQQWWAWLYETSIQGNKYCHCPRCGCEIGFPNRWKAQAFGVIFIIIIVVITVGHLLWK